MKRLPSSDSLNALISICPNSTGDMNDEETNTMYGGRELQAMLELGMEEEEACHVVEKKRRLSVDQVKSLEKNFEVENKLEPDRKIKLAQELGLQPRQVAVWFQNRRARWKTKQLERDYGLLKVSHDSLKLKFESLQKDNESLINQVEELKSKLREEGKAKIGIIKEEPLMSEEKFRRPESSNGNCAAAICGDFKDGSSDSDSSAILNEENNNNNNNTMMGIEYNVNESISQLVKVEEHDVFGEEESCSTFFSDDQAPCLNWYCADGWN